MYLQVLFFPGESVGQVFDVLGLMFLNMRMERLQNFTDQRADLLHNTARLLNFIHLEIPTKYTHSRLLYIWCIFRTQKHNWIELLLEIILQFSLSTTHFQQMTNMKYHETFSFNVYSNTIGLTACLFHANIFNNISQFFITVEAVNSNLLWFSSKQPK